MTAFIIIGDIIVCAFLAGLVAWLFIRRDDDYHDAVARLPLEEDES